MLKRSGSLALGTIALVSLAAGSAYAQNAGPKKNVCKCGTASPAGDGVDPLLRRAHGARQRRIGQGAWLQQPLHWRRQRGRSTRDRPGLGQYAHEGEQLPREGLDARRCDVR